MTISGNNFTISFLSCTFLTTEKATFNIVDFVDMSDNYALMVEEWSIKHFSAKPDPDNHEHHEKQERVEKVKAITKQLTEVGFAQSIRRRVTKELFKLDGVIRTSTAAGEIRRFLITRVQRERMNQMLDLMMEWDWQQSAHLPQDDRFQIMQRFVGITYRRCARGLGDKALFNISQWRNICWGAYKRKIIPPYRATYNGLPIFEYTQIEL